MGRGARSRSQALSGALQAMIDLPAFKTWINLQGISTPISFNYQPEDPTNHYTLIETGGFGTTLEDEFDRPSFQCLIRGSDGGTARTLASAFDNLMLGSRMFHIGDVWVLKIARIGGGPSYLGMDERDRPEYTSNYYLELARG
jgi:hypothetical protein